MSYLEMLIFLSIKSFVWFVEVFMKDLLPFEPVTSRFKSRNCRTTRISFLKITSKKHPPDADAHLTWSIIYCFFRKINFYANLFVSDLLIPCSYRHCKELKRRVRNLVWFGTLHLVTPSFVMKMLPKFELCLSLYFQI